MAERRSSEGIDVCGTRLGTEVLQLVSKNTGLETISMVGLSMGGLVCRFVLPSLLAARRTPLKASVDAAKGVINRSLPAPPPFPCPRFAAGMLYSPSTKRMAGLRPGHYISVATPHMASRHFLCAIFPPFKPLAGRQVFLVHVAHQPLIRHAPLASQTGCIEVPWTNKYGGAPRMGSTSA